MGKKLKNVMCGLLAATTVFASIYPGDVSAKITNRAVAIPVSFNNTTGASDANIEDQSSSFCDINLKNSMNLTDTITMDYILYIPKKFFSTNTSILVNPGIYAEYSFDSDDPSDDTTADNYDGYFYVENATGGFTITKEDGSYKVYDYATSADTLTESQYAKVKTKGNYVAIYIRNEPMLGVSSDYYKENTGSEDTAVTGTDEEDGAVANEPKPISEILGDKEANCRIDFYIYGYNTQATGAIYFDVVSIYSGNHTLHSNFNQAYESYSYEIGETSSLPDQLPSLFNLHDTQKITTKFTSKTYTASQLKKAKQTVAIGAKANTDLSYKVLNGSSYVSVDTSGNVTVKKNTPKGTYKIRVTAAAKYNYSKVTKTIKIVVK